MSSLPACLQVSQLRFPTSPSLRVTSTPCLRAPLASLAHTQLSPHLLCAHTDLPGTCPCSYPFPCTLPCHLLASMTTRDSCLCFRLPARRGLQAAVLLMWAIPCLALLPGTLHQGKPANLELLQLHMTPPGSAYPIHLSDLVWFLCTTSWEPRYSPGHSPYTKTKLPGRPVAGPCQQPAAQVLPLPDCSVPVLGDLVPMESLHVPLAMYEFMFSKPQKISNHCLP